MCLPSFESPYACCIFNKHQTTTEFCIDLITPLPRAGSSHEFRCAWCGGTVYVGEQFVKSPVVARKQRICIEYDCEGNHLTACIRHGLNKQRSSGSGSTTTATSATTSTPTQPTPTDNDPWPPRPRWRFPKRRCDDDDAEVRPRKKKNKKKEKRVAQGR